MANSISEPDIRAAVDRAAARLGERSPAADIEREAEKILASEWRGAYGSPTSRTPCRITADVCVADCSSRLPATVRALTYDRVRSVGAALAATAGVWTERPSPRPRLHVRLPDSAILTAGHGPGMESMLVETLDRAASDAGIDVIEGPVFQLSDESGLSLLETLPAVLRSTESVRPVLEVEVSSTDFLHDALYGLALALLARGSGRHAAELAIRTTSSAASTAFSHRPSITVTVTAGTGSDLAHSGLEAYRVGLQALGRLVDISSDGPMPFRSGAVLVALSSEHAAEIATRISAGSVRDALLADVPRGARTEVVVDGYRLGTAPRNRLTLTAGTRPHELAAELEARLGIDVCDRYHGMEPWRRSGPFAPGLLSGLLLSTPVTNG